MYILNMNFLYFDFVCVIARAVLVRCVFIRLFL